MYLQKVAYFLSCMCIVFAIYMGICNSGAAPWMLLTLDGLLSDRVYTAVERKPSRDQLKSATQILRKAFSGSPAVETATMLSE